MIRPSHQELIRSLTEICERSPHVRFGQLLANLGFLAEDRSARTLWEIEDEELLSVLESHLKDLSDRQSEVA